MVPEARKGKAAAFHSFSSRLRDGLRHYVVLRFHEPIPAQHKPVVHADLHQLQGWLRRLAQDHFNLHVLRERLDKPDTFREQALKKPAEIFSRVLQSFGRPMASNLTTSAFVPRPNFCLTQDIYNEIDTVSTWGEHSPESQERLLEELVALGPSERVADHRREPHQHPDDERDATDSGIRAVGRLQLERRRAAGHRLGDRARRDLRRVPDAPRGDGDEHQPGAGRRPVPRHQPAERESAEPHRRQAERVPAAAESQSRGLRQQARQPPWPSRRQPLAASVPPPSVGRSASGRSFSMMRATTCQVIGSM